NVRGIRVFSGKERMFGYVTPHRCELKVRELTQYQGFYCGLCKTLKREYGQGPRLVLDYDCAFLALLLQGVEGPAKELVHMRCGYKPFRKKEPVAQPSDALTYAADCNVLLYYYKLRDDWEDEKKTVAFIGSVALKRAVRRAEKRQPQVARAVEKGVLDLSRMEKAQEAQIDLVADAFAGILQAIAGSYQALTEKNREILRWLGYHLGRWIYLMDAYEDMEKDKKKQAYNPFVLTKADKERAGFLLYASLYEMEKAYDLLDIRSNKGLLDNILYEGCRLRTKRLLEGADG
ncbi:DUF5685 family protein, partial [Christensenellaceae bacterium OttesenSCG-928-M15]|nr:DUF5685 family protein [Christensenellaceae bacterium OttesenSCG-928-M15]